MEELIKELKELRTKIDNHNDGFIYKVTVWSFRSSQIHEFTNFFVAREFINHYNGDNGAVELITNNKKIRRNMLVLIEPGESRYTVQKLLQPCTVEAKDFFFISFTSI